MARFDERNNAEYGLALSATLSGTTAQAGRWMDMRGWEAITFTVATATVTAAGDSGISFQIEESDTTANSAATAVADADLIGSEADIVVDDNADDNIFLGSIGYIGTKRYVRIKATGTTNTNAVVNAHAIKRRGAVMATATIDAGTAAT